MALIREGGAVDNMMFYEFTVFNKSPNKYSDFRMGLFANPAIGNPNNDYIGFDSTHRMAITYNSALPDTGGRTSSSYGYHPPITGLTFVQMPGEACRGTMPAGSFDFFPSMYSGFDYIAPNNDTSYNNYMHAKNYFGSHIYRELSGTTYAGNYVFPNTELCDSSASAGNRKYVLSTNDYTFLPNTKTKLGMVFMATDTTGNACGHLNLKAITDLADTAWNVYCNASLGTHDVVQVQSMLKVYPNPAQTVLFIETKLTPNEEQVQVYDALGRRINISYARKGAALELNISSLVPGVYSLVYRNGTAQQAQTFVKE